MGRVRVQDAANLRMVGVHGRVHGDHGARSVSDQDGRLRQLASVGDHARDAFGEIPHAAELGLKSTMLNGRLAANVAAPAP